MNTKDHWQPQRQGEEHGTDTLSEPLTCWQLDFGLLSSWTVREYVFSHSMVVIYCSGPRKWQVPEKVTHFHWLPKKRSVRKESKDLVKSSKDVFSTTRHKSQMQFLCSAHGANCTKFRDTKRNRVCAQLSSTSTYSLWRPLATSIVPTMNSL